MTEYCIMISKKYNAKVYYNGIMQKYTFTIILLHKIMIQSRTETIIVN